MIIWRMDETKVVQHDNYQYGIYDYHDNYHNDNHDYRDDYHKAWSLNLYIFENIVFLV